LDELAPATTALENITTRPENFIKHLLTIAQRVFDQKSETSFCFFFNLSNGSVKRISDMWLLVLCYLCVFSQKKIGIFVLC